MSERMSDKTFEALAEAQAQMGAMRKFARHDGACQTISGIPGEPDATKRGPCTCGLDAALAPEAGKEALEWRESAMRVLAEWHEAREIIGGSKPGDGPIQWARRVRASLGAK